MESLLEYLHRRANSTLLVSYTIFWCILHWQGIYVTLFVDQNRIFERYHLLKNEYVNQYFFGVDWSSLASIHNLLFIVGLLIPGVLAYIYVWKLPKWAVNPAYFEEIKYRVDRRVQRIREEKRINSEETKLTEKKTDTVAAEIELAKKRAEAAKEDPTILWERDYNLFLNSTAARKALDDLLECIYGRNGYMSISDDYGMEVYSLSADAKMYADTWGLAEMHQNTISLTNKGRFFAQQYKTRIGSGKTS